MLKGPLIFIFSILLPLITYGQQPPQNPTVKVYYENFNNAIQIYADNSEIFPQSIKLELDYKGFKPKAKIQDFYAVAASSERVQLAELQLSGRGKASFSYKYTYFIGDIVKAKHNDNYAYSLPFRSEKPFKLTQSYNGKFSHKGQKSLDFTMPEGTEIVAVRDGVVIKSKEDSDRGCSEKMCLDLANYVTILHEDGSIAQYFHLQKNGVEVELEQEVKKGDLIGYSGNTGFTSGPHLHFDVAVPSETGLKTVSTKFLIKGKSILLEKDQFYRSDN